MSINQNNAAFQDNVRGIATATAIAGSISAVGQRVRVQTPRSDWISKLQTRFDELTSLHRGWDGYAGRPVSFTCAQFAANLIERLCDPEVPPPQLVPGSDGTLQFEWHRNGYDVEIHVFAPYEVVAVRREVLSGDVEEVELTTDFSVLIEWISELKQADEGAARRRA